MSAVGAEVKTEPVGTQVNTAQLQAPWCTVSQGSRRDFEVIGVVMSSCVSRLGFPGRLVLVLFFFQGEINSEQLFLE